MTTRLLLDTCAAIWIADDAAIASAAVSAIDASSADRQPIMVSPISAWEIGMLVSKGRLISTITPRDWFTRLAGRPEIALAPLGADILIDSSFLPGDVHNDPADRIIIATARALDLTVVTRDKAILDYANQGYVRALAC